MVGPEGNLRGSLCPVASSLMFVPPVSITSTLGASPARALFISVAPWSPRGYGFFSSIGKRILAGFCPPPGLVCPPLPVSISANDFVSAAFLLRAEAKGWGGRLFPRFLVGAQHRCALFAPPFVAASLSRHLSFLYLGTIQIVLSLSTDRCPSLPL